MNKTQKFDDILEFCLQEVLTNPGEIEATLANYPQWAGELRPLLDAALWINGRAASLNPRPGFVTASRPWVVAQARKPVEPVSWYERLFGSWQKGVTLPVLAAVALILFFFTFTAGRNVAATATSALPGETLYPVKLVLEDLQLAASLTDDGDVRLYVQFASRRIDEIEQLIFEGDTEHVELAVARYERLIRPALQLTESIAATDPDQAATLSIWVAATLSEQTASLALIIEISPASALPAIERVVAANDLGRKTAHELMPATATQEPTRKPSATQVAASLTAAKTHKPPTNTLKPTNEPKLTSTPRPTKEEKPTSTEKVTSTPKPTKEEKPTSTPKPTKEEKPTSTPKPTDPPKPTKEEKPTDPPAPTEEPKPTKEDKPTKEPKP